jgi:hypothetical protein
MEDAARQEALEVEWRGNFIATQNLLRKQAWERVGNLHIDTEWYQREGTTIVPRIVRDFDARLFEPLSVARIAERNNKLYVWDGGNRLRASRIMGFSSVPVIIIDVATVAEAAQLFGRKNTYRVSVPTTAIARADILNQIEGEALEIEKVLNEFGVTAVRDLVTEDLRFLRKSLYGASSRVFKMGGAELLRRVLYVIQHGWWDTNRDYWWYESNFVGIARFLQQHGHSLNDRLDDVVAVLHRNSPTDLMYKVSSEANKPSNRDDRFWQTASHQHGAGAPSAGVAFVLTGEFNSMFSTKMGRQVFRIDALENSRAKIRGRVRDR